MINVLHLTPHLGGGVGKAVSGLLVQAASHAAIRHRVACLERPEKNVFLDRITQAGGEVFVAPDPQRLDELIAAADIVQLEWWNHPVTIERLAGLKPQPMRLLVWCHVSGLFNPIIPPRLIEASHRFIFTSPCSLEADYISRLAPRLGARLAVVSSGAGFDGLPGPDGNDSSPLSAGYLGSLNFAKLHPRYVDFLAAVALPGFKVRLIGDLINRETLERQCDRAGRPGLLEFRGYTTDVASELRSINVMAYLLNPRHYGTAENALLEAMAMGIVPVVLDNPAERSIVEHLDTGLIVRSPGEFAHAMDWLAQHPEQRARIGKQASASVRAKFTAARMEKSLRNHYADVLAEPRRIMPFGDIFGVTPDQWFLSCQANPGYFKDDGSVALINDETPSFELFEKTKGTAFHFHDHFPDNARLSGWSGMLKNLQERLAA